MPVKLSGENFLRPTDAQYFLASIVESSDDSIITVNFETIITSWNKAAERLYGYPAAEAVGKPVTMLTLPDDLMEVLSNIDKIKQSREVKKFDTERIDKNGNRLFLEVVMSPVKDEEGKVIGVSTIARDITERKSAEEKLRESEERFRYVADAAPVLIWIADTTRKCIWFNKPWLEFTGRAMDEEIGDGWAEGVHPDDFERCVETYFSAFDVRESFSMEYRLRRYDGEYRWLLDNGTPSFAPNGEFLGYIGSCIDITDRKEAEGFLERYRLLSEKARDVIWLLRPDGQIVEVNQAAIDLYGYSREELLSMNVRDLREKPTLELVDEQLKKAVADGIQFETVHVRRDGTKFPVEINANSANFGGTRFLMSILRDITERKRAEENLRQQKRLLEALTESVLDGILIVSPEGRMIHLNQHFLDIWNFPPEVVESQSDETALAWAANQTANPAAFLTRVSNVYEQPDTEAREELPMKDGRVYERFGAPIYDGETRLGWVWTFRDITTRKRTELNAAFLAEIIQDLARLSSEDEIMRVTSEKIGAFFDVRHCALTEFDTAADLAIVRCDWRKEDDGVNLVRTFRLSEYFTADVRETILAGTPLAISDVRTDSRTAAFAANYERLKIRSLLRTPYRVYGNLKFGITVNCPAPRQWRDDEIELLRELAARIWTSIERARAEEALRESEERLQLAIDISQTAAFEIDLLTDAVKADRIGREIYGWDDSPLTFNQVQTHFHPADRDAVMQSVSAALAPTGADEFEVEQRIVRADGETRWIRVRGRAFFDGTGESKRAVRCLGTYIDITERKLAEQERERLLESEQIARAEAEKANRLKDEFLATVSHELRTPLNAILGWAAMARKNDLDTETISRALEVIERSARNQKQIISDILDVSRIITGKLHLNVRPLRLSLIVQAAIDTVRPSLDAKQIRLETAFDADNGIKMSGDLDRLQQIVWNLLSNAVKFTPEDGKIEVLLRYRNNFAEIVVSDTGSGIEPEFLPFVFDRFRQADGKMNRKHSGLGLGLAVVRHLTELHGGSVSVESEGNGQGAAFTIRLPLKAQTVESNDGNSSIPNADAESVSEKSKQPKQLLKGLKILVVDDERDALELAAFILAGQGALVSTAESVDEALKIFDRESAEVIVSDIGMPEKDGYELIREIMERSSRQNRPIPTIALTAYAGEIDNERVLEAGYRAFLPKPVEPAELVKMIAELTSQNQ